MKSISLSLLFFASTVSGLAQSIKFEKPVEYNDFIIKQQTRVAEAIKGFYTAFSETNDSLKTQEARKKIVLQADSAVATLKRLLPFGGDTAFKQSAIRLYAFYGSTARIEYDKVIRLAFDPSKKIETIRQEIGVIVKDITEREKILDAAFQAAQGAFASRHAFSLDNETKAPNR